MQSKPGWKPSAAAKALTSDGPVDADLVKILAWPRGHDGEAEKLFCKWIESKLEALGHKPTIMEMGAIFVEVRRTDDKPNTVLFSCHTDTVHGPNEKGMQALVYDPEFDHIALDSVNGVKSGSCLGGDNGVGVWLMLKMIEAKKPGGYMFHRGEEKGCISSMAMARYRSAWLGHWKQAVAFDRRDDYEVITHQGGQECCSPEYAKALATELSIHPGMQYEPSNRGLYTDTRSYRYAINECVNIGCGYYDSHSANEYVDWNHMKNMLVAIKAIDWESLPVKRVVPAYPEPAAKMPTSGTKVKRARGKTAGLGLDTFKTERTATAYLLKHCKSKDDLMDWFDMEPEEAAKLVMMALLEGQGALKLVDEIRTRMM